MDFKKISVVMILLLLIASGIYVYMFVLGNSLYGKGKSIEISGENSKEISGMRITINNGGYFKGWIPEIINEVAGEGEKEAYLVFDAEIENNSKEINDMQYINIKDKDNNVLGSSIFVYEDISLEYSMDRNVIDKYKLLLNGREFLPGEKRRGAIYIPLDKPIDKNFTIELEFGDKIEKLDTSITNKWFDSTELEKLKIVKTKEETNITIGNLNKGLKVDTSNSTLNFKDSVEITIKGSTFFKEVPPELLMSLSHLVNSGIGGDEKLLFVDVEIKNIGDKELHVGNFNISPSVETDLDSTLSFKSIRVVSSKESGNEVLDDTIVNEYKLFNFRGFGNNTTPLKVGETISGNLIFIDSAITNNNEYNFYYEDLEGNKSNSSKLEITN